VRRLRLVLATLLAPAACATTPRPPPAEPPAPAAALSPVGFMTGRWDREDGRGIEHWTPAGDALVGVAFTVAGDRTRGFEALLVHEVEGRLAYSAMPNGVAPIDFPLLERDEGSATFENKEHDFPQRIRYAAGEAGRLTAVVSGPGADDEHYAFRPAAAGRVPELEAADRAYGRHLREVDLDAAIAAFAERGVLQSKGGERAQRPGELRARLRALSNDGAGRLEREAVASGLSPAGDAGYTVGQTRLVAGGEVRWRAAHATIWRKDDAGRWRITFEVMDRDDRPEAA
jgi:ketosteroid isomerase-like protein